ncbi:hypothetical protein BDQ12DRAFT_602503 [Crucibulum laeve]|uniref:Uncharacterized protein n=1 Tax=Crucibulum laeve TaxID=68775 RepID=A0A5C3M703_9AGAR|nr:hypothetical protein BDQ12DRAFT_602503 [Crucibulum laeve]
MHDASTSTPLDIGLLPKPCHSVPGLWFVKTGLSELGFLECEFEIDQETATKWDFFELANGCPTEKKPSPRKPQLSLQLLCLPIAEVQSVYARLTGASADDVATVMSKIKTGWPMSGHLLIEVNPKKSFAKAWLPYELDPETPPELKGYVQEGTNVVRFTQLSGMSDCVFVLYASATKTPEPAFTNLDGYLATMKSAPSSAFPGIRPATVSVMDS